MAVRTAGQGESEGCSVMEQIPVAQLHGQNHRARKRADFPEVLHTRELGKSAYETKQMTTAQAVGAVSSEAADRRPLTGRPSSSTLADSKCVS